MVPRYSAADLYTQLKYIETMFDVARAKDKLDAINTANDKKAQQPRPDGSAAPTVKRLKAQFPSADEVGRVSFCLLCFYFLVSLWYGTW